jgi:pimeloyl-ACP methyl ester carboxylesterase
MPRIAVIVLVALTLSPSLPMAAIAQSATPAAPSPSVASGGFAGLVDIGSGRGVWLECQGHGSPTVLLEAGSGDNADVWDTIAPEIALASDAGAMAVLPRVAAFTRVCAYDRYQAVLTAEQWADLHQQTQPGLDDDPERERMDFEASFAQLRDAATHPLPPLPLVVLMHGDATSALVSPQVQSALPPDVPWDALEAVSQELQDELAALVPGARHVIATKSGHYIQLQQPAVVIEAIRQVVVGVRNSDTWDDLTSRCTA